MKRRISLLLALVIVLGSFGTAFAATPTTGADKAKFLEEKGILKGSTKGDLMLDKKETRQNMVVMLSRLMAKEEEAKAHGVEESAKFEDLTDKYYKPFVAWSVANNYITGKTETKFGSKENVTAQQYSTVLLRALGHFSGKNGEVEHTLSFETAKKLGLLEGTGIKAQTEEITREQMSTMIYNALGTNMKGSEKTLADHLGIKMPEEEVTELKVNVRTENLKEVIVELNKELTGDDLKVTDNYRIKGNKVEAVAVEGKTIVLSLENELKINSRNELTIRNLSKANKELIGNYRFQATDNQAPEVLSAQYLGRKGILVTFSEPVNGKETRARDFKLDGKNIVMDLRVYGRQAILTPYGKEEFKMDEHKELTVARTVDFAGIQSSPKTVEIKDAAEGYELAPEVVEVTAFAASKKVRVTFDKPVLNSSLAKGNKGNIVYLVRGIKGGHATDVNQVAPTVVEYSFDRALNNRNGSVEISGVKNHDEVEMTKVEKDFEVIYDRSEPVVLEKDVIIKSDSEVIVELTFDKDMSDVKKADYEKVARLFDIKKGTADKDQIEGKVNKVVVKDNLVTVYLEGLDRKISYLLEVRDIVDNTDLKNKMLEEYTDIHIGEAATKMIVTSVELKGNKEIDEIELNFSKKLDRETVENAKNYTFVDYLNRSTTVEDLGGYVELDRNGYRVNIVLPNGIKVDRYKSFEVSRNVKGLNGEVLEKAFVYDFEKEEEGNKEALKELEEEIGKAKKIKEADKDLKAAIKDAEDVAKDKNATTKALEEAKATLEKAVEDFNLRTTKTAAKEALDAAAKAITGDKAKEAKKLADEGKKAIDEAKEIKVVEAIQKAYTELIEALTNDAK